MSREELETFWWVVVYAGAVGCGIVLLRTLFVPPSGAGTSGGKSPFEVWIEFSRERAHQELQADLEKYRIDRGIHRTQAPQEAREQTS